jgi:Skp family chaperone for outer membrane proteins
MAEGRRPLLRWSLLVALASGCASTPELAAPPSSLPSPEEQKVAIVDMQAVVERTQAGARLLAAATAEVVEASQRARAAEVELDQQLEAGRIGADERDRQRQQLVRDTQALQRRLPRRRKELLAPLDAKVASVVKTIAEQEGVTLVLVKGRPDAMMITWHSSPELDLTERVIAEINRLYP